MHFLKINFVVANKLILFKRHARSMIIYYVSYKRLRTYNVIFAKHILSNHPKVFGKENKQNC